MYSSPNFSSRKKCGEVPPESKNKLDKQLGTSDLEELAKHLGADADPVEVGELPGTDEDPHELKDAPDDLEEHVPPSQRVHPAEEDFLTAGALEVAGHLGTAHCVISTGVHTAWIHSNTFLERDELKQKIKLQGGQGWDSQL